MMENIIDDSFIKKKYFKVNNMDSDTKLRYIESNKVVVPKYDDS